MKLSAIIMAALLAGSLILPAQTVPENPEHEGRELARELSAMAPLQEAAMNATLFIERDRRTEVSVLLEMKLVKAANGWKSIYQTKDASGPEAACLVIRQTPGEHNAYELKSGTNDQVRTIAHNAEPTPFAGSDFWLADLGLEFFRWQDQRVIKHEIRRGQSCYVLQSVNPQPAPGAYARVVSWIDRDTLGIVRAEAYDAQGKLLKLFLPTKVKKVEGRYQIKEVEMRNEKTGLKSRLVFDLETP